MMAPGRCVPTAFVEEAPLWLLFFPFFLLSPPHVFTNLDFVKTDSIHAVTPCPEVPPPILAAKLGILLEDAQCQLPLKARPECRSRCIWAESPPPGARGQVGPYIPAR
jgi:hypothetical protein